MHCYSLQNSSHVDPSFPGDRLGESDRSLTFWSEFLAQRIARKSSHCEELSVEVAELHTVVLKLALEWKNEKQ